MIRCAFNPFEGDKFLELRTHFEKGKLHHIYNEVFDAFGLDDNYFKNLHSALIKHSPDLLLHGYKSYNNLKDLFKVVAFKDFLDHIKRVWAYEDRTHNGIFNMSSSITLTGSLSYILSNNIIKEDIQFLKDLSKSIENIKHYIVTDEGLNYIEYADLDMYLPVRKYVDSLSERGKYDKYAYKLNPILQYLQLYDKMRTLEYSDIIYNNENEYIARKRYIKFGDTYKVNTEQLLADTIIQKNLNLFGSNLLSNTLIKQTFSEDIQDEPLFNDEWNYVEFITKKDIENETRPELKEVKAEAINRFNGYDNVNAFVYKGKVYIVEDADVSIADRELIKVEEMLHLVTLYLSSNLNSKSLNALIDVIRRLHPDLYNKHILPALNDEVLLHEGIAEVVKTLIKEGKYTIKNNRSYFGNILHRFVNRVKEFLYYFITKVLPVNNKRIRDWLYEKLMGRTSSWLYLNEHEYNILSELEGLLQEDIRADATYVKSKLHKIITENKISKKLQSDDTLRLIPILFNADKTTESIYDRINAISKLFEELPSIKNAPVPQEGITKILDTLTDTSKPYRNIRYHLNIIDNNFVKTDTLVAISKMVIMYDRFSYLNVLSDLLGYLSSSENIKLDDLLSSYYSDRITFDELKNTLENIISANASYVEYYNTDIRYKDAFFSFMRDKDNISLILSYIKENKDLSNLPYNELSGSSNIQTILLMNQIFKDKEIWDSILNQLENIQSQVNSILNDIKDSTYESYLLEIKNISEKLGEEIGHVLEHIKGIKSASAFDKFIENTIYGGILEQQRIYRNSSMTFTTIDNIKITKINIPGKQQPVKSLYNKDYIDVIKRLVHREVSLETGVLLGFPSGKSTRDLNGLLFSDEDTNNVLLAAFNRYYDYVYKSKKGLWLNPAELLYRDILQNLFELYKNSEVNTNDILNFIYYTYTYLLPLFDIKVAISEEQNISKDENKKKVEYYRSLIKTYNEFYHLLENTFNHISSQHEGYSHLPKLLEETQVGGFVNNIEGIFETVYETVFQIQSDGKTVGTNVYTFNPFEQITTLNKFMFDVFYNTSPRPYHDYSVESRALKLKIGGNDITIEAYVNKMNKSRELSTILFINLLKYNIENKSLLGNWSKLKVNTFNFNKITNNKDYINQNVDGLIRNEIESSNFKTYLLKYPSLLRVTNNEDKANIFKSLHSVSQIYGIYLLIKDHANNLSVRTEERLNSILSLLNSRDKNTLDSSPKIRLRLKDTFINDINYNLDAKTVKEIQDELNKMEFSLHDDSMGRAIKLVIDKLGDKGRSFMAKYLLSGDSRKILFDKFFETYVSINDDTIVSIGEEIKQHINKHIDNLLKENVVFKIKKDVELMFETINSSEPFAHNLGLEIDNIYNISNIKTNNNILYNLINDEQSIKGRIKELITNKKLNENNLRDFESLIDVLKQELSDIYGKEVSDLFDVNSLTYNGFMLMSMLYDIGSTYVYNNIKETDAEFEKFKNTIQGIFKVVNRQGNDKINVINHLSYYLYYSISQRIVSEYNKNNESNKILTILQQVEDYNVVLSKINANIALLSNSIKNTIRLNDKGISSSYSNDILNIFNQALVSLQNANAAVSNDAINHTRVLETYKSQFDAKYNFNIKRETLVTKLDIDGIRKLNNEYVKSLYPLYKTTNVIDKETLNYLKDDNINSLLKYLDNMDENDKKVYDINNPEGIASLIRFVYAYKVEKKDEHGNVITDEKGNIVYEDKKVITASDYIKLRREEITNLLVELEELISNSAFKQQIENSTAYQFNYNNFKSIVNKIKEENNFIYLLYLFKASENESHIFLNHLKEIKDLIGIKPADQSANDNESVNDNTYSKNVESFNGLYSKAKLLNDRVNTIYATLATAIYKDIDESYLYEEQRAIYNKDLLSEHKLNFYVKSINAEKTKPKTIEIKTHKDLLWNTITRALGYYQSNINGKLFLYKLYNNSEKAKKLIKKHNLNINSVSLYDMYNIFGYGMLHNGYERANESDSNYKQNINNSISILLNTIDDETLKEKINQYISRNDINDKKHILNLLYHLSTWFIESYRLEQIAVGIYDFYFKYPDKNIEELDINKLVDSIHHRYINLTNKMLDDIFGSALNDDLMSIRNRILELEKDRMKAYIFKINNMYEKGQFIPIINRGGADIIFIGSSKRRQETYDDDMLETLHAVPNLSDKNINPYTTNGVNIYDIHNRINRLYLKGLSLSKSYRNIHYKQDHLFSRVFEGTTHRLTDRQIKAELGEHGNIIRNLNLKSNDKYNTYGKLYVWAIKNKPSKLYYIDYLKSVFIEEMYKYRDNFGFNNIISTFDIKEKSIDVQTLSDIISADIEENRHAYTQFLNNGYYKSHLTKHVIDWLVGELDKRNIIGDSFSLDNIGLFIDILKELNKQLISAFDNIPDDSINKEAFLNNLYFALFGVTDYRDVLNKSMYGREILDKYLSNLKMNAYLYLSWWNAVHNQTYTHLYIDSMDPNTISNDDALNYIKDIFNLTNNLINQIPGVDNETRNRILWDVIRRINLNININIHRYYTNIHPESELYVPLEELVKNYNGVLGDETFTSKYSFNSSSDVIKYLQYKQNVARQVGNVGYDNVWNVGQKFDNKKVTLADVFSRHELESNITTTNYISNQKEIKKLTNILAASGSSKTFSNDFNALPTSQVQGVSFISSVSVFDSYVKPHVKNLMLSFIKRGKVAQEIINSSSFNRLMRLYFGKKAETLIDEFTGNKKFKLFLKWMLQLFTAFLIIAIFLTPSSVIDNILGTIIFSITVLLSYSAGEIVFGLFKSNYLKNPHISLLNLLHLVISQVANIATYPFIFTVNMILSLWKSIAHNLLLIKKGYVNKDTLYSIKFPFIFTKKAKAITNLIRSANNIRDAQEHVVEDNRIRLLYLNGSFGKLFNRIFSGILNIPGGVIRSVKAFKTEGEFIGTYNSIHLFVNMLYFIGRNRLTHYFTLTDTGELTLNKENIMREYEIISKILKSSEGNKKLKVYQSNFLQVFSGVIDKIKNNNELTDYDLVTVAANINNLIGNTGMFNNTVTMPIHQGESPVFLNIGQTEEMRVFIGFKTFIISTWMSLFGNHIRRLVNSPSPLTFLDALINVFSKVIIIDFFYSHLKELAFKLLSLYDLYSDTVMALFSSIKKALCKYKTALEDFLNDKADKSEVQDKLEDVVESLSSIVIPPSHKDNMSPSDDKLYNLIQYLKGLIDNNETPNISVLDNITFDNIFADIKDKLEKENIKTGEDVKQLYENMFNEMKLQFASKYVKQMMAFASSLQTLKWKVEQYKSNSPQEIVHVQSTVMEENNKLIDTVTEFYKNVGMLYLHANLLLNREKIYGQMYGITFISDDSDAYGSTSETAAVMTSQLFNTISYKISQYNDIEGEEGTKRFTVFNPLNINNPASHNYDMWEVSKIVGEMTGESMINNVKGIYDMSSLLSSLEQADIVRTPKFLNVVRSDFANNTSAGASGDNMVSKVTQFTPTVFSQFLKVFDALYSTTSNLDREEILKNNIYKMYNDLRQETLKNHSGYNELMYDESDWKLGLVSYGASKFSIQTAADDLVNILTRNHMFDILSNAYKIKSVKDWC